ncbi:MAG: hypothetical protein KDA96_16715 [Planctomycetaceae bacterium]|nr:hypothetical protein [Planctomycetaceae bacterium]
MWAARRGQVNPFAWSTSVFNPPATTIAETQPASHPTENESLQQENMWTASLRMVELPASPIVCRMHCRLWRSDSPLTSTDQKQMQVSAQVNNALGNGIPFAQ